MKIALRSHHSTLAELNLTPLLDLVFVLLVIFIITTPQLMNNLELALPSDQTQPIKPAEPVRIRVVGRDQIQMDSQGLTFAEFKTELAQRKLAQPNLTLIVEGADHAEYQAVVNVLEVIQDLNITEVGLATTSSENFQKP